MSRHHTCHAVNCDVQVPPRMHMCRHHWYMVPKALRDALWAAYRPGQERTLTPSAEYLGAAARCVGAVGEAEGQPPADIEHEVELYMAWAEMVTE